jgi:ABC-2 type transport system ATP-binding protein
LLHRPKLLLLDEPTAGVDPKARREFWDELHTLAHEGITVLVATHYMDEAERCDEIVFIAYGELLAKGRQDEVLAAAGIEPGGGNLEEAFVRLIGQAHDNYAATP